MITRFFTASAETDVLEVVGALRRWVNSELELEVQESLGYSAASIIDQRIIGRESTGGSGVSALDGALDQERQRKRKCVLTLGRDDGVLVGELRMEGFRRVLGFHKLNIHPSLRDGSAAPVAVDLVADLVLDVPKVLDPDLSWSDKKALALSLQIPSLNARAGDWAMTALTTIYFQNFRDVPAGTQALLWALRAVSDGGVPTVEELVEYGRKVLPSIDDHLLLRTRRGKDGEDFPFDPRVLNHMTDLAQRAIEGLL